MFIDKWPKERPRSGGAKCGFRKRNVSLLTERGSTFLPSWPINISPLMGRRLQPAKFRRIYCANFRVGTLGRGRRSRPDQFLVHELLNPEIGKLLAVSGTLDSAEWQIGGAHRWIIDKDHAGFDPARNLLAVLNIGGIDRATQPKGRVVCNSDRLILIPGGKEECDRTKEFLSVGRIVRSDVGKNRWLHVRARFTKPISSGEGPRAIRNRFTDLIKQKVQCGVRGQRRQRRRFIQRVARLALFESITKRTEELLCTSPHNDEAFRADASLSSIAHTTFDRHFDGIP